MFGPRGCLPVGSVVPGFGTVRQVSLTAYLFDGAGWVSFDRVHGRPVPVSPLVIVGAEVAR